MNFIYSVAWILASKLKFENKVIFSETGKWFENQYKITYIHTYIHTYFIHFPHRGFSKRIIIIIIIIQ